MINCLMALVNGFADCSEPHSHDDEELSRSRSRSRPRPVSDYLAMRSVEQPQSYCKWQASGSSADKSQMVRLIDVFLLGPLMVWAGAELSSDYQNLGPVLAVSGIATVLYNGANYVSRDRTSGQP